MLLVSFKAHDFLYLSIWICLNVLHLLNLDMYKKGIDTIPVIRVLLYDVFYLG